MVYHELCSIYLHIEPEVDDIAILNDILAPFDAYFAGGFGSGFAAKADVSIEGNHLGANKAELKIGVNDAGGFGRFGSIVQNG